MQGEKKVAIKVWDVPVRVFHWAIVLLLLFQLVSGKIGGDLMNLHAYSGYTVLALVALRVVWGFVGSTHARFSGFVTGPVVALRFARRLFSREAVPHLSHNPLGGWMVIALLLLLALQGTSGLFANDGAAAQGPLAPLVPEAMSNLLTEFHRWNIDVLLLFSVIHVAAVAFHLVVKKENLTAAMFTGVKHVAPEMLQMKSDPPPRG